MYYVANNAWTTAKKKIHPYSVLSSPGFLLDPWQKVKCLHMGPHCFSDNAIYYSVQGRKFGTHIPEHWWCFLRVRLLRLKEKKEWEADKWPITVCDVWTWMSHHTSTQFHSLWCKLWKCPGKRGIRRQNPPLNGRIWVSEMFTGPTNLYL